MPELCTPGPGHLVVSPRMSSPRLSLIVAVYNKPTLLRYVFAALGRQSFTDFEVIIADDGSGPEIRDAVAEATASYGFPLVHLWHEDIGWRKNIMLNNAIRAARADWLVFTDGDCLPSKHFLLDHWNEREKYPGRAPAAPPRRCAGDFQPVLPC